MSPQLKELIENRAQALGHVTQEILLNDEANEIAGVGFRWAYLILRRPRKYLEAFRHGELRIDPDLLDDAFNFFSGHVPGAAGLMAAEHAILEDHNQECSNLMNHYKLGQKSSPTVIGIASR